MTSRFGLFLDAGSRSDEGAGSLCEDLRPVEGGDLLTIDLERGGGSPGVSHALHRGGVALGAAIHAVGQLAPRSPAPQSAALALTAVDLEILFR